MDALVLEIAVQVIIVIQHHGLEATLLMIAMMKFLTGDVDTDTSAERSSPKEHTVRSHGQHYIKNGERVWIEKEAYPRSGKKDE